MRQKDIDEFIKEIDLTPDDLAACAVILGPDGELRFQGFTGELTNVFKLLDQFYRYRRRVKKALNEMFKELTETKKEITEKSKT